MKTLYITCSPQGDASESTRLAQSIVSRLALRHSAMEVQHLDLGGNAGARLDAAYAHALGTPGASSAQGTASDALAQSEQWISQLERADAVVIATPMHNFTLPATLKNWIDHVVRIGRTFRATPDGKVGMLADRPVFVAIASGGTFSGSGQRQPDFLTGYLRAILAIIGLHNLTFFSVEGTVFGAEALALSRQHAEAALEAHFSQVSLIAPAIPQANATMPVPPVSALAQLEANKHTVCAFYEVALNQRDFPAAAQYMGPTYTQHNPMAEDGPEGFAKALAYLKQEYPDWKSEIRRVWAEGDFVILHLFERRRPEDIGNAVVDIFRLSHGKVVEHWDVTQALQAHSANANGML